MKLAFIFMLSGEKNTYKNVLPCCQAALCHISDPSEAALAKGRGADVSGERGRKDE